MDIIIFCRYQLKNNNLFYKPGQPKPTRRQTLNLCQIIIDRRDAIRKALEFATTGDAVLITGKGTDPYIMGANNTKIPWDDATVVREEMGKIQNVKIIV